MKIKYRLLLFTVCWLYVSSCVLLAQSSPAPAANIEDRVSQILGQLTLEQKIDMLGGTESFYIRGFDSPKLPPLKMADGPMGVRNWGLSTAYPAGIALAASWDPALARRIGESFGRDARAKGVHFLLAPGVNIYRAPMNGRNFEYFGEDPWLASRIAVNYIQGVQSQGVSATTKHYIGNNSEYDRHNTNSEIDERTMREIYLPTFEAAVKEAQSGAIMDSYNLINGEHATQNSFLNTELAKKEWGFQGIIMSDWDATYDGVAAANSGLDLEMPSGKFMNRQILLPAVQQGKVPVATIDDKIRRILRTALRFGWYDRPQIDPAIPRYSEADRQIALQGALESIVLLKNEGNLLPLNKQKIKTIAVIGPNAHPTPPVGGGSARVEPFRTVSYLEGMSSYLGTSAKVLYNSGIPTDNEIADRSQFTTAVQHGEHGLNLEIFDSADCTGTPQKSRRPTSVHGQFAPAFGPDGQTTCKRWSGYFIPPNSGTYRWFARATGKDSYTLYVDEKAVLSQPQREGQVPQAAELQMSANTPVAVRFEYHQSTNWLGSYVNMGVLPVDEIVSAEAKQMAQMADAAIVFIGYDPASESEGADRDFKLPPNQDDLIQSIHQANKNTIVVLTGGGNADMSRWIDAVPALLHGWYLGQESGRAMPQVIFGDVSPSGRLPATFERRWEDNPVHDSYYPNDPATGPTAVKYKEGVFVGYRGYEHNNVKPLFPFGFGLSYTTFKYSNLAISAATTGDASKAEYQVAFDVTNTGQHQAADVAQVYVGDTHSGVARPAKELKAFTRVELRPGETRHVTVKLDGRSFSYYDVSAKQWHAAAGTFDVLVGRSSAEIVLRGNVRLAKDVFSKP